MVVGDRLSSAAIDGVPLTTVPPQRSPNPCAGRCPLRRARGVASGTATRRRCSRRAGQPTVINVLRKATMCRATAMRPDRLRLTAPDARLVGALASCGPGRTIDVSIIGLPATQCVVSGTRPDRRCRSPRRGPSSHSELLWRRFGASATLAASSVPFGYWARASGWTALGAGVIAAAVVLLPAPFAAGAIGAAAASGIVAGLLAGRLLRAARRHLTSDDARVFTAG